MTTRLFFCYDHPDMFANPQVTARTVLSSAKMTGARSFAAYKQGSQRAMDELEAN